MALPTKLGSTERNGPMPFVRFQTGRGALAHDPGPVYTAGSHQIAHDGDFRLRMLPPPPVNPS